MKSCLCVIVLAVAAHAQEILQPSPLNGFLAAYTKKWMVWNVQKPLPGPFSRPALENSLYLQSVQTAATTRVYRDTIGMIQSVSPVWIWDSGEIVCWDGFFSRITGKRVYLAPSQQNPTWTSSYPIFVSAMKEGVIMLADHEKQSVEAFERAYWVPWSFDDAVIDLNSAQLITDSVGVSFFNPQIRHGGGRIVSLRTRDVFVYDVATRIRSAVHLADATPGEHLAALDDRMMVTVKGTSIHVYGFDGSRISSCEDLVEPKVLAVRGGHVYCIRGLALTKSDTLVYELAAFNAVANRWTRLAEVFNAEWEQHEGPVWMNQEDYLWLWSGGRWKKFKWLK